MIATFLALPQWARRALAIGAALLSLWAAWALYIGHVERQAVREHEAKVAAEQAKAREAADAASAARAAVLAVENAQADQRAADAIARAQASDPAGVKRQAGPATQAVLEGLR